MSYERNIEARSRNHCCKGKAKRTTFSECVFVALGIHMQRAHFCAVLYCHLWLVRLYHIFPRHLINGTIFGNVIQSKMRVLIF